MPRRLKSAPEISWVAVPEAAWTSRELWLPMLAPFSAKLPYPTGSAENRFSRRARERRRRETLWHDRTLFTQAMCASDWAAYSGDLVARPSDGHIALVVIP